MNREAEKLQGLLARVERNRRRPGAVAAAPMAQPEARRPRSPSPLEIAVESELGDPTPPRGSQAPVVAQPRVSQPAQQPRPEQHTPAMFPAVTQSPRMPMRNEPMLTPPIAELRPDLAAPAVPISVDARGMGPPSAPIVRSTGTITPARALTFGELIAKTLALRP